MEKQEEILGKDGLKALQLEQVKRYNPRHSKSVEVTTAVSIATSIIQNNSESTAQATNTEPKPEKMSLIQNSNTGVLGQAIQYSGIPICITSNENIVNVPAEVVTSDSRNIQIHGIKKTTAPPPPYAGIATVNATQGPYEVTGLSEQNLYVNMSVNTQEYITMKNEGETHSHCTYFQFT